MKKLLAIVVLGLLISTNVFAEKIRLKCQDLLFDKYMNVNFDDKMIEVVQDSGENKVNFKIEINDERYVGSYWRVLEKGKTGKGHNYNYSTSISDWNEWYKEEFKKSIWAVEIDRMNGTFEIYTTEEPYKKDLDTYNVLGIYKMECKKRRLQRF